MPKADMQNNPSPTVLSACEFLDRVKTMLIEKNAAYGDSVANPLNVFSKLPPVEGVKVRIDDKLKRIACGYAAGEDVVFDLVGYLAMLWALEVSERKQAALEVWV